jgi:hypothetical protein
MSERFYIGSQAAVHRVSRYTAQGKRASSDSDRDAFRMDVYQPLSLTGIK